MERCTNTSTDSAPHVPSSPEELDASAAGAPTPGDRLSTQQVADVARQFEAGIDPLHRDLLKLVLGFQRDSQVAGVELPSEPRHRLLLTTICAPLEVRALFTALAEQLLQPGRPTEWGVALAQLATHLDDAVQLLVPGAARLGLTEGELRRAAHVLTPQEEVRLDLAEAEILAAACQELAMTTVIPRATPPAPPPPRVPAPRRSAPVPVRAQQPHEAPLRPEDVSPEERLGLFAVEIDTSRINLHLLRQRAQRQEDSLAPSAAPATAAGVAPQQFELGEPGYDARRSPPDEPLRAQVPQLLAPAPRTPAPRAPSPAETMALDSHPLPATKRPPLVTTDELPRELQAEAHRPELDRDDTNPCLRTVAVEPIPPAGSKLVRAADLPLQQPGIPQLSAADIFGGLSGVFDPPDRE